jgi:hypothetical protein
MSRMQEARSGRQDTGGWKREAKQFLIKAILQPPASSVLPAASNFLLKK